MKNILLIVAASMLVWGCATTRPTYQSMKTNLSAKVIGDTPNLIRLFSEGESGVHFVEVDGLYVSQKNLWGFTREVFLEPGSHKLTIELRGSNHREAQAEVAIEVEAQKIYLFTAQKIGSAFDVKFWRCKDDGTPEYLINQFRVLGRSGPQPMFIPIVIPSGR